MSKYFKKSNIPSAFFSIEIPLANKAQERTTKQIKTYFMVVVGFCVGKLNLESKSEL